MRDPIPPGHGEPERVPEPLRPRPPEQAATGPGALPPLAGVPHCPCCWGYHPKEEPCPPRAA